MDINDGEPGVEWQIDFAQVGFILDAETQKKRRVHALIFRAVISRHMFVWLTHSQTLVAMIAGCEAREFFGGVFKSSFLTTSRPVVAEADAVNPRLSVGWLDYAQHAGFATDPARVRTPRDKPRVERAIQYVPGNFWGRGNVHRPGRRPSPGQRLVFTVGRDAVPRHHRRPAGRDVHQGGGVVSVAGPGGL